MYPFANRFRWITASRYAHLAKGLTQAGPPRDPVLRRRLEFLRWWDAGRAATLFFLSIGLLATTGGWIARFLPDLETAVDVIDRFTAGASAFSGFLTLVYLLINRVLGQLEADIVTLVARAETE